MKNSASHMARNIAIAVAGVAFGLALCLAIALKGPELMAGRVPEASSTIIGIEDPDGTTALPAPAVREVVVVATPDPEFYAPMTDLIATVPPEPERPADMSFQPETPPNCVLYRVVLPPAIYPDR